MKKKLSDYNKNYIKPRKVLVFGFLLIFGMTYSQQLKMYTIGDVTLEEMKMPYYSKDSTADVLILAE